MTSNGKLAPLTRDEALEATPGRRLTGSDTAARRAWRTFRAGDHRSEATLLSHLGNVYAQQGRLDEARPHLDAALAQLAEPS